jgi:hypothetical protein
LFNVCLVVFTCFFITKIILPVNPLQSPVIQRSFKQQ